MRELEKLGRQQEKERVKAEREAEKLRLREVKQLEKDRVRLQREQVKMQQQLQQCGAVGVQETHGQAVEVREHRVECRLGGRRAGHARKEVAHDGLADE